MEIDYPKVGYKWASFLLCGLSHTTARGVSCRFGYFFSKEFLFLFIIFYYYFFSLQGSASAYIYIYKSPCLFIFHSPQG
jgi:hypothetical protein